MIALTYKLKAIYFRPPYFDFLYSLTFSWLVHWVLGSVVILVSFGH
jgi:hypothetical protein